LRGNGGSLTRSGVSETHADQEEKESSEHAQRLTLERGCVVGIQVLKKGRLSGIETEALALAFEPLTQIEIIVGQKSRAIIAPLLDFVLCLVHACLIQPEGHIIVLIGSFDGFLEVLAVDSLEGEKRLIEGTVEMVTASGASHFGAAFVYSPGKNHIIAEADIGTAGRDLGEIFGSAHDPQYMHGTLRLARSFWIFGTA
jgi:hypothetical protein